jgi:hypothetical protein
LSSSWKGLSDQKYVLCRGCFTSWM